MKIFPLRSKRLARAALMLGALGAPLPPALAAPAQAAEARWQFGDTHAHDDHSSDGSLPRQTMGQDAHGDMAVSAQIGRAEETGLDFLPLTDHRTYDQHYDPLWTSSKLLLIPGEEANGSPHATVLGAVDTIVQGGSPVGSPAFRVVQQSVWDAHAQDAVWNTAHPDDGELNDDNTPNVFANVVDVDNIETWNKGSNVGRELIYAEDRWNHGFRSGIVAASDDHFRQFWFFDSPGMPATGVHAAPGSARALLDALRAGRTTLRGRAESQPSYPTVTLEADLDGDGAYEGMAGDELVAAAGTPGRLRVEVRNGFGATVYVYRCPGRAAGAYASFRTAAPAVTQSFLLDIATSEEPSWYRVEVRGPGFASPAEEEASARADADAAESALAAQQRESFAGPRTGSGTVGDFPPRRHKLHAQTPPIFIGPRLAEPQSEIAVPADQGQDEGAEAAIGAIGAFAGFPDLAQDGAVAHVVAEAHDGAGNSQLIYRRRAADGGWSAALDLAPGSNAARFPKIAARAGQVWVVWQDARGGEVPQRPEIWMRHSSDGGLSWAREQRLRGLPGRAEHPALALTQQGQPLVAWQEIAQGRAFDIMVQVVGVDPQPLNLSGDGKTVQPASAIDARSARYPASVWPSVAVAADGRLAVGWQDNRSDLDPLWTGGMGYGNGTNPDNWQVMLRTAAAPGLGWNATQILGNDTRADRHPSLAFAADGRLVAAWDSRPLQAAGANLSIQAASWSEGEPWSAVQTVAENAEAMSQWPNAAQGADGRVELAWFDARSADWRWRVMRARLQDDQSWSAGELLASPGNNTWPALDVGALIFATTRNAQRSQRDRTQEIVYLPPATR